ncbi:MAG TPA: di-heme oxidoredictase family protein, partial [Polyangiaceae bacterium]|nr:di-heme oxidoredictase family protein [Polyangiaceae bacterium]
VEMTARTQHSVERHFPRFSARRARELAAIAATTAIVAGCSSDGGSHDETPSPTPLPVSSVLRDQRDVAISGISRALDAAFVDGDNAFDKGMRDGDGLGPLYTRISCSACHDTGMRGPGLVQKMSVVEADGVTPSADQSLLPWGHTVHPLVAAGEKDAILPPMDKSVLVTTRVGPPIIGRGYMEAIDDAEIERVESEQASRSDSIHGHINHVVYASEMSADETFHTHVKGDTVIGRFGLKARVGTLDDFVADAFQGDMGITSPLRPSEIPNPDGLLDDDKPGLDVELESIQQRAIYLRLLAIPDRNAVKGGSELFEQTLCSICHVPSMHTRADYPIPALADIDAPVYSDLLIHHLGPGLADGLPADPSVDYEASSFEWRTTPLVGVRLNRTYLHDSRATTVEDAITAHGGDGSEANDSVERFNALSDADRKTLLDFVEGL